MDAPPPRAASAQKLLGTHAEPVCHDLEKTPRSGGALIVHKKVLHRAAGYADDFRILPADVDHEKIVPPVQKARAARVAGDLRDALSGVRHGDAPVPRRNTGARFRRKVRRFELGADALRRVHTAPARRPRREQGRRPVVWRPPSLHRWSRYRCRWRSPCRDSPFVFLAPTITRLSLFCHGN